MDGFSRISREMGHPRNCEFGILGSAGNPCCSAPGVRPKDRSPDGLSRLFEFRGPDAEISDGLGGGGRKLVQLGKKGGALYAWTADGKAQFYARFAPFAGTCSTADGQGAGHDSHPKLDIHGVEPSPDMKWVAFHLPGIANSP